MINSLFSTCWLLSSLHIENVAKILATALQHMPADATSSNPVAAGAVDDASRMGLPVSKFGRTALVKTVGPMIKAAGWMARYGIAGTRETQAALMSAAADPEIDNIVWIMDTPGGSVDGLEELAATVRQVKQEKPVIVQVDGLLASAGYYVASQASKIYAAEGDLIGSIGTRISLYDYSKLFEERGIKAIPIDTGEHKSAGMIGTVITDDQIAEFQRIVDGYFEMFLSSVESGRGMSRKQLEPLADGRVFFANESVESGLIDGVQTLSRTVNQYATESQTTQRRSTRAARVVLAELGA